jgi:hypothetical protein
MLTPPPAGLREAAMSAGRRQGGRKAANHRAQAHEKNNIRERKTAVFAWKQDFSPVASALPEEKQFFAGD